MTTVAASLDQAHVYNDLSGLHALRSSEGTEAEKIRATAKQFESMMLNLMLKSMRKANDVFAEGNMLNTHSTQFYQDMLDQQLSLTMTRNDGLGLADMLARQLNQEIAESSPRYQTLTDYPREPFTLYADKNIHSTEQPIHPLSVQETEALEDVEHLLSNLFSNVNGTLHSESFSIDEQKLNQGGPTNQPPENTASRVSVELYQPTVGSTSQADVTANEPLEFATPREFITTLLPAAQRVANELGVDPKLLLAQAALETGWGKHMISTEGQPSFNLFGIKADHRWQGATAEVTTTEYRQGVKLKEQAAFRAYNSYDESFRDYLQFLKDNSRYQHALANRTTPQEFVQELQKAGYATDPEYARKILRIYQSMADDPTLQQRTEVNDGSPVSNGSRG